MINIDKERTIKVYEYPLRDFRQSEKAIWINTRRDDPGFPSLYDRIFIPISQVFIDNRGKRLFISKFLMDRIISEYKRYSYMYKFILSSPIIHNIKEDRWLNAKGKHN